MECRRLTGASTAPKEANVPARPLCWGEWVRLPGQLQEGPQGPREAPLSVAGGAHQDGAAEALALYTVSPTALPERDPPPPPRTPCLAKVRENRGGETRLQGGTDAAGGSGAWPLPPVSNLPPHAQDRPEKVTPAGCALRTEVSALQFRYIN